MDGHRRFSAWDCSLDERPATRSLRGCRDLVSNRERNLDVDFLKPLTWDDKIELYASVAEVRDHAYTILITAINEDGDRAFTGKLTQVCVSTEDKSIAAIPEKLHAALERLSA